MKPGFLKKSEKRITQLVQFSKKDYPELLKM